MKLAGVFTDHMVLQHGMPVPVWGTDAPGTAVAVTFNGQTHTARADENGAWRVTLRPLAPGGPHTLTVRGSADVTLDDVLVGEVWLCSGQSNMEWPLMETDGAQEELEQAELPRLRLATVPRVPDVAPRDSVAMQWSACTRTSAKLFSAVGYHFGKLLLERLHMPVGLINCSWGGSCAEAWTPMDALDAQPLLQPIAARFRAQCGGDIARASATWNMPPAFHQDTGNEGAARGWAAPDCDTSAWRELPMPGYWQHHGWNFNGAVWLRRDVRIPRSWRGHGVTLSLGRIDDFDTTYFNGVRVGETSGDPAAYATARTYHVPAALVRPGRNVIAVRVFDHFGNGGMTGPADTMCAAAEGMRCMACKLAGTWLARVERELPMANVAPFNSPLGAPAVMYNGMIAPLVPFALRGVIWYQGESNASRAQQYRTLFPAMIEAWRERWGQPSLPFLFVQLANFKERTAEPMDDEWAELREAQTSALRLPDTGMAVSIDIGDAHDIHPRNKRAVGQRLAAQALANVYGLPVPCNGPQYRAHRVENKRIRISFDHVERGLMTRRGKLRGFAIAGADRKFVWARTRLGADTVLVWSDHVAQPVAVRYAWASNPLCNLYNSAGLPAVPFRTDDWPGITDDRL